MGKCKVCGLEAGWFSKVHKDCKNKPATLFVASTKSKKYHLRSCRFVKEGTPDLVDVKSIHEAMIQRFTACKVCKPNQ